MNEWIKYIAYPLNYIFVIYLLFKKPKSPQFYYIPNYPITRENFLTVLNPDWQQQQERKGVSSFPANTNHRNASLSKFALSFLGTQSDTVPSTQKSPLLVYWFLRFLPTSSRLFQPPHLLTSVPLNFIVNTVLIQFCVYYEI